MLHHVYLSLTLSPLSLHIQFSMPYSSAHSNSISFTFNWHCEISSPPPLSSCLSVQPRRGFSQITSDQVYNDHSHTHWCTHAVVSVRIHVMHYYSCRLPIHSPALHASRIDWMAIWYQTSPLRCIKDKTEFCSLSFHTAFAGSCGVHSCIMLKSCKLK